MVALFGHHHWAKYTQPDLVLLQKHMIVYFRQVIKRIRSHSKVRYQVYFENHQQWTQFTILSSAVIKGHSREFPQNPDKRHTCETSNSESLHSSTYASNATNFLLSKNNVKSSHFRSPLNKGSFPKFKIAD